MRIIDWFKVLFFLCLCMSMNGCLVESLRLRSKVSFRKFVASTFLATSFSFSWVPSFAGADEAISKTFPEFINLLEKGDVEKVVFKGVRPEYCLAFFRDGTVASVREGFPAYDDPKSASGPAQSRPNMQVSPAPT